MTCAILLRPALSGSRHLPGGIEFTPGYPKNHSMVSIQSDRAIRLWLSCCALLVFCMVLFGGAVRLTGSGLSMVDWKPLLGILPPLSHDQWLAAFEQYKQFPEYQLVNAGMSLDAFRFIYLMEYGHRLLGRVIGIVFFVPFVVFLVMRRVDSRLVPRLWLLFALGGLQGLVGWYMVKSGLVDDPSVSQYRLTLHLLIAFLIYLYMVRLIAGIRVDSGQVGHFSTAAGLAVLGLVLVMVASGGLVAGTRAGFIFNTFPLTGGQWIPDQLLALQPAWRNLFENPVTIQFLHRCLAALVLVSVLLLAIHTWRSAARHGRLLAGLLAAAVLLQVSLGIATLLLRVPVVLGVAHQAGALLLVTAVTATIYLQLPPIAAPASTLRNSA